MKLSSRNSALTGDGRSRVARSLRCLHQALLALNIGLAAAWAILVFLTRSADPFRYLFLSRVVAAINRCLLGHTGPLGGPGPGWEVVLDTLALVFALLFLGLLALVSRTAAGRVILDPIGGMIALAVVPACWLLTAAPVAYLNHIGWMLTIELILACGVAVLTRKLPVRAGCAAPYLAFHYGLWIWLIVTHLAWPSDIVKELRYVVWPCAGVIWVLYAGRSRRVSASESNASAPPHRSDTG